MFEVLNKLFGYRDADIQKYLPIVDADIAHYRLKKGYKVNDNVVQPDKKTD